MVNKNLIRQHQDFYSLISVMQELLNDIDANSQELAKSINLLAGKLNVHLQSEDRFLYPELLNSNDMKVKQIAINFVDEMGHLADTFTEFKFKYNTSSKILKNISSFKLECPKILNIILNRLKKEDKELYILL